MRLATMGLTAEEVIDRGGINAALKGCKSATVADLSPSRSDLQRELEDTERQIQRDQGGLLRGADRQAAPGAAGTDPGACHHRASGDTGPMPRATNTPKSRHKKCGGTGLN